MINVNTASEDEIRSVPGIGRKGAKHILDRSDAIGDMDGNDLWQVPLFREVWLTYLTFDDPGDMSDYAPDQAVAEGGQSFPILEASKPMLLSDEGEDDFVTPGQSDAMKLIYECDKFEKEQVQFIIL